jgi:nucleoside-diphosphate-sugar epimerase
MLKCGITGSSGTLGQILLKNLPFHFVSFDHDITDYKKVDSWIKNNNFDLIIHLAAIVPTKEVEKNYFKAKKVNVLGTKNLVRSIVKKKIKPKWIFFSSTSHVYKISKKLNFYTEKVKPNPYSKYGVTKFLAEKEFKKLDKYDIKICIGRIFSFTDKNQNPPYIIPTIIKKIKKRKNKIFFENLNHYRDFISTKQISTAIHILQKKKKSGIYNICNGRKINLMKIAKIFAKKNKKEIDLSIIKKPTYLLGNNKKLKSLGFKSKKFNNNIDYFYK